MTKNKQATTDTATTSPMNNTPTATATNDKQPRTNKRRHHDSDLINATTDIAQHAAQLLNDNYEVLRCISPIIADGELCRLLSVWQGKNNDDNATAAKKRVTALSGFKAVTPSMIDGQFRTLWKKIRNTRKWHFDITTPIFREMQAKRIKGIKSSKVISEFVLFDTDHKQRPFKVNATAIAQWVIGASSNTHDQATNSDHNTDKATERQQQNK